jgi:hypothetical protein
VESKESFFFVDSLGTHGDSDSDESKSELASKWIAH